MVRVAAWSARIVFQWSLFAGGHGYFWRMLDTCIWYFITKIYLYKYLIHHINIIVNIILKMTSADHAIRISDTWFVTKFYLNKYFVHLNIEWKLGYLVYSKQYNFEIVHIWPQLTWFLTYYATDWNWMDTAQWRIILWKLFHNIHWNRSMFSVQCSSSDSLPSLCFPFGDVFVGSSQIGLYLDDPANIYAIFL